MNKSNIVLIGMPGSGKSTIGVQLAKWTGMDFVDSDIIIQKKMHQTLFNIIAEYGNKGFIKLENDINKEIDVDNTVIATGGSAVYGVEAMEHFKEIGEVVYLNVPLKDLKERLGDLFLRGVVSSDDANSLEEIWLERESLYEKYADLTINLEGTTPETAASMVYELCSFSK